MHFLWSVGEGIVDALTEVVDGCSMGDVGGMGKQQRDEAFLDNLLFIKERFLMAHPEYNLGKFYGGGAGI